MIIAGLWRGLGWLLVGTLFALVAFALQFVSSYLTVLLFGIVLLAIGSGAKARA